MKKIITHDGTFHADEVFSVALIKRFVDSNVSVVRTRDREIINESLNDKSVFVLDVGRGFSENFCNFDHHQQDFNLTWKNDSSVPFSTCGLIWFYIKKKGYLKKYSEEFLDLIQERLIKKIDLHDNKLRNFHISNVVSSYNRSGYDNFDKAVDFACEQLDNLFYHIKDEFDKYELYKKDSEKHDGGNVFISSFPIKHSSIIKNMIEKYGVNIVCYPHDDRWYAKAIGNDNNGVNKVLAPLAWRGVSEEDLARSSGLKGAIFVHKSGFLCVAKNKKTVVEMAKQMQWFFINQKRSVLSQSSDLFLCS